MLCHGGAAETRRHGRAKESKITVTPTLLTHIIASVVDEILVMDSDDARLRCGAFDIDVMYRLIIAIEHMLGGFCRWGYVVSPRGTGTGRTFVNSGLRLGIHSQLG